MREPSMFSPACSCGQPRALPDTDRYRARCFEPTYRREFFSALARAEAGFSRDVDPDRNRTVADGLPHRRGRRRRVVAARAGRDTRAFVLRAAAVRSGDAREAGIAALAPGGGDRLGRAQRAPPGDGHERARTSRCAPKRWRRWPRAGLRITRRVGGHRSGRAARGSRRFGGQSWCRLASAPEIADCAAAAARRRYSAADGDDAGGRARIARAGCGARSSVPGVIEAYVALDEPGDVHRARARRRAASQRASWRGDSSTRTTRTPRSRDARGRDDAAGATRSASSSAAIGGVRRTTSVAGVRLRRPAGPAHA